MPSIPPVRRAPSRRALAFALVALSAGLGLAGCASQAALPPPPLKTKGTPLPTRAGPVHPTQAAYHGPAHAMYVGAARYFRWPLLVPAVPPGGARAAGATVSRLFAGSWTIDRHGRASQVPGSFVPGNPVAPAAYQLRLTFLGGRGVTTLFEAVHAYAPPTNARRVALPGGLTDGRTWQSRPAPGAAPLRYLEGRVDGFYLMVYAPARTATESALSAYFRRLRAVAVPPGKAPVAKADAPAAKKGG